MIRFTVVSFALVVLLAPARSAVAQTVYEEGNFDLAKWTLFGPFITPEDNLGGGAFDAAAPASGGNPGGYLRISIEHVSVPLGSSFLAWALFINDEAEYQPTSQGAIQRVDFDFDARLAPDGRNARTVTLAVEQDGFVWAAIEPRLSVDDRSWLPKWISGLEAADFVVGNWGEQDQPGNPDFSETASPIKFGIAQGQSCPVTSDCRTIIPLELDIDNWRVAVNESGYSLTLSVAETASPGPLTDLPLQFRVSAKVRNTTSPDLSDLTVRFLLPKEELADFTIPEDECIPDSASRNDFVIADCAVPGPVGPASTETVEVPTAGISVGYAAVVPAAPPVPDAGPPPPSDRAVFTYKAGVLPLVGTDPDPANDVADLVDVVVCNPTGMDPVTVDDITDCDDLMTGGTSGSGGGAGTGGTDMGGSSDGCGCDVVATNGSAPWLLILGLAGAAVWLRRRYRHI
ncbi:MAG: MYXO-CTERM sorting domain-containing protein [Myxococcales bacterium]|nr:MYXO-CTERM sorting domain-containing protein [Myxococcales bacterium]MDH3484503.1 MYXO-CTERM sorting domain-containing protein [Myxococcales bacterium]